jgi:hypothetical protein
MDWNIYDFGIFANTIVVGIGLIISYILWYNDVPKKKLITPLFVVSVGFLAFCYCGYMSHKYQTDEQDLRKQEIYVDNHKATCYIPDQVDDGLCNVEIPKGNGLYRLYLHSRSCPCFRPLKDTVIVAGHKYLKMRKLYIHAPNCN